MLMTFDSTAPATKQDVRLLMDEIGKLYRANERWKDEILDADEKWKEELKQHFFLHGALPDKIQNHENRLVRLEDRVGIVA